MNTDELDKAIRDIREIIWNLHQYQTLANIFRYHYESLTGLSFEEFLKSKQLSRITIEDLNTANERDEKDLNFFRRLVEGKDEEVEKGG